MSILANSNAIESGGYNLERSLRFRSSASAYLSRTPASTGNRKTLTYSIWLKRGILGVASKFGLYSEDANNWFGVGFNASDNLEYDTSWTSAANRIILQSAAVFRDPSSWYHVVVSVDTTQSTAANRIRIYLNNVEQTFTNSTGSGYVPQNTDLYINVASVVANIGRRPTNDQYFDGYMTEINFIDGQALTPSSFGATDATTGVWQPAKYTGTYGTNGFYLPFTDNSALTTSSNVGLGKDFSGNSNYWVTNNISITAGTTYDSMTDVPTLTSATAANYSVVNPLDKSSVGGTISNGNLTFTNGNAGAQGCVRATIGISSGKWYWETTCSTFGGTNPDTGIVSVTQNINSADQYVGNYALGYSYGGNGQKRNNNSGSAYGASYTSGDIIGVAFDADAGTLTFYKNNTSQGTAFTGLSGTFAPAISGYNGVVWNANFGQRPFSYTPPTGFVALNTFNLPTPTILKGNLYMDSTLWTGNGSAQTIVNAAGFRPDFVWIKQRSSTEQHQAMDSVRGSSKVLNPNLTNAESTDATKLTSFNSNGFSVGSELAVNRSGFTYVGWQWQAGQGSTSSNTSGTITSTTSVNTTAGFSIVTYTGNGTGGATVGHGLGVAPKFIIVKTRSNVDNWPVGTSALGWDRHTLLNLTSATAVTSSTWNDTSPTSTVFSIGTDSRVNSSGWTYVAYCWAEIAGFSKFGSYTGNGSADGPFVYLGFRPEWILVKQSSSAGNNWQLLDSSRNTYNKADNVLFPSSNAAEGTGNATFDFLSNGFKIRAADGTINTSSSTYIYMAFAENPFKNANAR